MTTLLPAIAGIYDPHQPLDGATARAALSPVAADDEAAVLVDGPLALAHREAAVGVSSDAHCVLAGSVWNLDGTGRPEDVLATRCRETEVGAALLQPLRGSFATALWDGARREGLLAADRRGSYAIYYAELGSRLYFASEAHLLLELLPRRPAPSTLAIIGSLGGGGVPGVSTSYEGVHRLADGSFLKLGPSSIDRREYWAPSFGPPLEMSRAELVTELWRHVEDAAEARIAHGDRTAIMMSGGVDSSCVAAASTRRAGPGDELTGYTAVFPDYPDVDESARIAGLAQALSLRIVEVRVQPAGILRLALDFLERWETGLPGPGYVLEHELLRRAAADGARVVLDGQGGDEIFGLRGFLPSDLFLRGRVVSSWDVTRQLLGGAGRSRREVARAWRNVAVRGAVPHRLHVALRRRANPSDHVPPWLRADAARTFMEISDTWEWKKLQGPRSWAFFANLAAGAGRWGFAEYLRRRAAPFGVEARPPLLDPDLTDFVLRTPAEASFDPFTDRPLIREAMIHLVPDFVRLERRKSNLSPFYFDGVMSDFEAIRRLLLVPDAHIFEFVERASIHDMLARPPGRDERGWLRWLTDLWKLVGVEAWLRREEDSRWVVRMLEDPSLSHPSSDVREQE